MFSDVLLYRKNPLGSRINPYWAIPRVPETTRPVPGAPEVVELGTMQFLNGYGFLLLFHVP